MAPAPAQDERRRAGSARGAAAQEQEHEQDARRTGSLLGYLDEGAPGALLAAEADSDASSSSGDSDDASSTSSWDSAREAHEAQLQWDESVRQLQALLNLVAVPWVSRYFGRKWAYSRASPLSPSLPLLLGRFLRMRLTGGGARAQCLSGTSTSGSARGSGSGPSRSTRPSRGGEPKEEQGRFVDLPLALHPLVLSLCARES